MDSTNPPPLSPHCDGPDTDKYALMATATSTSLHSLSPTDTIDMSPTSSSTSTSLNPLTAPDLPALTPHTTTISLVSITATSSAFPESFGLSISPKGRWVVAYSSSVLYVLSAAHLPDYKNHCRVFRIRRKPLAVAITDTGRFAVLTTPHKIDVYQCGDGGVDILTAPNRKLHTVYLNNEAKALALSSAGDAVAAGSDGGIEICNLSPGCLETDKRHINSGAVETLSFSEDGRSLLITGPARRCRQSTVISIDSALEDTFNEDIIAAPPPLGKIWISQLLFPERFAARQAAFLPESGPGPTNELLAYDAQAARFAVFDMTAKRFSSKKLDPPPDVRWGRSERPEDPLPAISSDGRSAAVAVRLKSSKEIWVYRIPPSWRDDASPTSPSSAGDIPALTPCQRAPLPPKDEAAPAELLTCVRWLQPPTGPTQRLIALLSTVTLAMPEDVVPTVAPTASGKILLIDFSSAPPSPPATLTLSLDDLVPTEALGDEQLELEREVDLVRRRTQIHRSRPEHSPGPRDRPRRSLSSGSARNASIVTLRDLALSSDSHTHPSRRRRSLSSVSTTDDNTLPLIPDEDGPIPPLDEPYANAQPRSHFSLHRAATVAATANRTHLRALPERPLEYRRADGLREMPHESDADNWVPPPPPYSAEPEAGAVGIAGVQAVGVGVVGGHLAHPLSIPQAQAQPPMAQPLATAFNPGPRENRLSRTFRPQMSSRPQQPPLLIPPPLRASRATHSLPSSPVAPRERPPSMLGASRPASVGGLGQMGGGVQQASAPPGRIARRPSTSTGSPLSPMRSRAGPGDARRQTTVGGRRAGTRLASLGQGGSEAHLPLQGQAQGQGQGDRRGGWWRNERGRRGEAAVAVMAERVEAPRGKEGKEGGFKCVVM
ncbi:hypothetical protein EJ06DRAFT_215573 [Trichodelitschia bisporula]|uniref:DUF7165 domain-containing protein n=1 Tax=Trichodelitschia bisporula TaxID=703511 RepID=A0A6G1I8S7_9PEZI|nr:hypothetical protein EJ06DRAFT_215573 [Trichodelitschia bisporula]